MTNGFSLSPREKEVLRLLMQGLSNKQIAARLNITEHTVEFHLSNAYEKLGASSRVEALLKLRESPEALAELEQGESTVGKAGGRGDNNSTGGGTLSNETRRGRSFRRLILFLLILGVLGAAGLAFGLVQRAQQAAELPYRRECEYPDASTVGQMMARVNAFENKVHGQFGTEGQPPWNAQAGYVIYKNIRTPQVSALYLKLRYSKNTQSQAPILVYLDDETQPRAVFYPLDQKNWDQFVWSEALALGKVRSGTHSLKLATDGQLWGVADLDRFVLSQEEQ